MNRNVPILNVVGRVLMKKRKCLIKRERENEYKPKSSTIGRQNVDKWEIAGLSQTKIVTVAVRLPYITLLKA